LLRGPRRRGPRGASAASRRRSDGYEFAELRAYAPGDDPRRIDWAATARAGDLQTRVVFEDHALVVAAAIDASASMFVGRTRALYDVACEAAALWYDVVRDGDRALRIVAGGVVRSRELRADAVARQCADVREPRGTPFEETLALAGAIVPRGAALLLVSDFFELEASLARIAACAARADTYALIARDPWAGGLPLGGFVRLSDAESGAAARVFIGARERERFHLRVREREDGLRERLEACGVTVGILAVDAPETSFEAFL
jgi:uncharacterized protein (DUF58 family)